MTQRSYQVFFPPPSDLNLLNCYSRVFQWQDFSYFLCCKYYDFSDVYNCSSKAKDHHKYFLVFQTKVISWSYQWCLSRKTLSFLSFCHSYPNSPTKLQHLYLRLSSSLFFIDFHKLMKKVMSNRMIFFSNDFKVRINILILKSVIIVFYLTSNSNSIRSQQLIIIHFCCFAYLVNKLFFKFLAVSNKFANWNAKFFDKG